MNAAAYITFRRRSFRSTDAALQRRLMHACNTGIVPSDKAALSRAGFVHVR
jgi:hypothetical protein